MSSVDRIQQADTSELTTLYELSDGGKAEWWPKEIIVSVEKDAVHLMVKIFGAAHGFDSTLVPDSPWWSHALAILRDSAERWLRGRGEIAWSGDGFFYTRSNGLTVYCDSLAEAIRVEMRREG